MIGYRVILPRFCGGFQPLIIRRIEGVIVSGLEYNMVVGSHDDVAPDRRHEGPVVVAKPAPLEVRR